MGTHDTNNVKETLSVKRHLHFGQQMIDKKRLISSVRIHSVYRTNPHRKIQK